jgi:hypothetical protein
MYGDKDEVMKGNEKCDPISYLTRLTVIRELD